MKTKQRLRTVIWVGDAKKRLKAFPRSVQRDMGEALMFAQAGDKHALAKPMKGFGTGVFEIAKPFDTDTYRSIYAVLIGDAIYVLHAFQKKAKRGSKTPPQEIELIKQRLKAAQDVENANT